MQAAAATPQTQPQLQLPLTPNTPPPLLLPLLLLLLRLWQIKAQTLM
jgi:hypothetical protein